MKIGRHTLKAHGLKTDKGAFKRLWNGDKTAKFRKNDRDFKVGEILVLEEHYCGEYTGNYVVVRVTDIVYGPEYGIPDGYCMMSIKELLRFDLEEDS